MRLSRLDNIMPHISAPTCCAMLGQQQRRALLCRQCVLLLPQAMTARLLGVAQELLSSRELQRTSGLGEPAAKAGGGAAAPELVRWLRTALLG